MYILNNFGPTFKLKKKMIPKIFRQTPENHQNYDLKRSSKQLGLEIYWSRVQIEGTTMN